MKKWLAIVMIVAALTGSVTTATAASKDSGAAALLSLVMPGTGEWYNNDWKGSFPFGECIIGHICFCIQLSSALDAANGNTDSGLRIDFWSAPVK
jgi:hypothetical protein